MNKSLATGDFFQGTARQSRRRKKVEAGVPFWNMGM
jgi:hypothetical protein